MTATGFEQRMRFFGASGLLLLILSAAAVFGAEPVLQRNGRRADGRTTVIAHRGASGERPEHTIAAYRLALEQGADLIEMDLQLSRDGVLIGLHDTALDRVTDVAEHPEFATRRRTDKNGKSVWRPQDFSFDELRTLRIRHRINDKPTAFDRRDLIPTFAEQIALVREYNARTRSRVGLCPELKDVAGHKILGLDLESAFLKAVDEHQLAHDEALPVVVQCFELEALERLRPKLGLPMAFLTASRPDASELERVLKVADIIAVNLKVIQTEDSSDWIRSIHQRGAGVVAWTYRDDSDQMRTGIANGLDGFFTDFPAAGIAARSLPNSCNGSITNYP